MSDTEKDDSPPRKSSGDHSADSESLQDDNESLAAPATKEQQKQTMKGLGFQLPSPQPQSDSGDDSSEETPDTVEMTSEMLQEDDASSEKKDQAKSHREKKRTSLSERLRKLAGKSSSSRSSFQSPDGKDHVPDGEDHAPDGEDDVPDSKDDYPAEPPTRLLATPDTDAKDGDTDSPQAPDPQPASDEHEPTDEDIASVPEDDSPSMEEPASSAAQDPSRPTQDSSQATVYGPGDEPTDFEDVAETTRISGDDVRPWELDLDDGDNEDNADDKQEQTKEVYDKTDRVSSLPFDVISEAPEEPGENHIDRIEAADEPIAAPTDRVKNPAPDLSIDFDELDEPGERSDSHTDATERIANAPPTQMQQSSNQKPEVEAGDPESSPDSTADAGEATPVSDEAADPRPNTSPTMSELFDSQSMSKHRSGVAPVPESTRPSPPPGQLASTPRREHIERSPSSDPAIMSKLDTDEELSATDRSVEPVPHQEPPQTKPEEPPPQIEPSAKPEPQTTEPAPNTSRGDDTEIDQFETGHTKRFKSPYENEPITPRLTTLEGPATGRDFLINRVRNSIGRGTNNSITVPDQSMSRKHFEIIEKTDDAFIIRDLMAVNGTSLNGILIKEADLFHGDRVEAGHSIFQFVIPGEAPTDSRQRHLVPSASAATLGGTKPAKKKSDSQTRERPAPEDQSFDKLLLVITIVAGVLSVPLMVFLFYSVVLDHDEPEPTQSAYELYFEGVEAFQNQDWDRAGELFEESYQVDPEFGEVQAQLERIEEERRARALIESTEESLDDDISDEVLDKLRAISHDSSYYDDAQALLSLIHQTRASVLFERAQTAYEFGDLEVSRQALDELRAIAPEHEGALSLQEAIDEGIDDWEEEEEEEEESADAEAEPRPTPRPRAQPRPSDEDESTLLGDPFALPSASGDSDDSESDSPRGRSINFTDGYTFYRAGQFGQAISHFETIAESSSGALADRAERTAADIRNYQNSLEAAKQARDNGNFSGAIEHFEQARQADEAVAGSFGRDIANHLASSMARKGLSKLEDEDYSAASDLLGRARAHNAQDSDAATLGRQLEQTATTLYQRAAQLRDNNPDQAAQLCRTVVTMVPPSSEPHQQARQLLDTLE